MQKKYNIIMFGMSTSTDWFTHGVANRNFHIVRHLLQSPYVNKILYVDYLPTTFKRTFRDYVESKRAFYGKRNISPFGTQPCYELHERFYVLPSHYYKISHWMFAHNLVHVKRHVLGKKIPLITWAYLPWSVPFWNALRPKITVFDSVDDLREHPSYASIRHQISKMYERVNKNATIIFTVSTKLFSLYAHHPSCFWIPNGVDRKDFTPRTSDEKIQPFSHPLVLYAGTIQDRIDFPLIRSLAEKNPEKTFLFVGNVWRDAAIKPLKHLKNIVFTGHIPYEKLWAYFASADAAIIPHKITRLTESMNPLKLYEYLAAGLPVISTNVAGTQDFAHTIAIADTHEQFHAMLQKEIAEDTPGKRERRIQAIQQASWTQRVEEMFSYICAKT